MDRKRFLQTAGLLFAAGMAGKVEAAHYFPGNAGHTHTIPDAGNIPATDLHVHRSDRQTIEDIVAKSKAIGITFGVMENIAPWGIRTDEELKAYIDALKPWPVYIGLQPMSPGWSANLSPGLIAQADYVAMDPQIVPSGNGYGEQINVWEYASYIDSPEAFMERNMQHCITILTADEPLDIFACPLLLPISIQREYAKLWTRKRMRQIIDAAAARNIAIEINDLARTPHEEFIRMAKKAGLKFTFGSDTRDQKTGRLDYCRYIASRCGLTEKDFFLPERKIG
ncbi:MAG: hypothetical protein LBF62_01585 [Tannerellaceae bacterium]|jgi:hypothetical protein|nr:hypothetical protein [Tannerellaceae bacterium]